jgi:hypothetical protein
MRTPRIGRPPTYRTRVRFPLYLEARDLPLLHAAAKAAGIPTSTWACRLLLEAAQRDTATVHERRAARGRDAVDAEGHRAASGAGRARAGRTLLHAPGSGPPEADLQVGHNRAVDRRTRGRRGTRTRHQKGRT